MEREPKNKTFFIEINGERVECTPDNTFAFLHENTKFDHMFYVTEHEEGRMNGIYIWRCEARNFDNLVYFMVQNGYSVENQDLQKEDLEAYKRQFTKPDRQKLTPRQKNHVKWLGYLLAKDLLTPDDFKKKRKSIL